MRIRNPAKKIWQLIFFHPFFCCCCWTRDPRSGIRDPGSEIRDPGSGIRDPGSEIRDPRSGIRDPGSEIREKHPRFATLERSRGFLAGRTHLAKSLGRARLVEANGGEGDDVLVPDEDGAVLLKHLQRLHVALTQHQQVHQQQRHQRVHRQQLLWQHAKVRALYQWQWIIFKGKSVSRTSPARLDRPESSITVWS